MNGRIRSKEPSRPITLEIRALHPSLLNITQDTSETTNPEETAEGNATTRVTADEDETQKLMSTEH